MIKFYQRRLVEFLFAEVIVDIEVSTLDKVFDYFFDDENISVGDRVLVPFGPKTIEGYVLRIKKETDYDVKKVKSIIRRLDAFTAIKPEFLKILNFMTDKYHIRKSSTLKLFIPSDLRGNRVSEKKVTIFSLSKEKNIPEYFDLLKKTAVAAKKIIMFMEEEKEIESASLSKLFSQSAIRKLKEDGVIVSTEREVMRTPHSVETEDKNVKLTSLQKKVIQEVKDGIYLLHGVTGSGKTEVYLNLISNVLKESKSAIMLVPEISLTPQMLSNFKSRFGDMVAILHSGLSAGERYDEWRRLHQGVAKVALGARSAIFAPLENVGVIIIDEEHERSYVSETNPRYSSLDVAEFRAKVNGCPLILGSATPSLESYNRAEDGEIKLLELPVRINGKDLPKIQIVDMMNEIRHGNSGIFSNQLLSDLNACVQNKKQAMLFINRRGFASFMRCRECGYVAKCTDCDVSLVFHKAEDKLKCHYCGKQYKALVRCPSCNSNYIRQGAVGTEQVVSELKKLFPDVKVLRMDNDTTGTKNAHSKILSEFKDALPGILVGTQMIAKGHDFSQVTLAGIIDADQSLYNSDYASTERTFQLITQMSGRAGRSDFEGKVVLQTYVPKHYVYRLAANYDYKGFYKKEVSLREATNFPPHSRIIRILLSDESEELVRENLKICYNKIQEIREQYMDDFYYLNVMKSPIKRISNKYRYQILARVKKEKADQIEKAMHDVVECDAKVSVFFEINPQNLS